MSSFEKLVTKGEGTIGVIIDQETTLMLLDKIEKTFNRGIPEANIVPMYEALTRGLVGGDTPITHNLMISDSRFTPQLLESLVLKSGKLLADEYNTIDVKNPNVVDLWSLYDLCQGQNFTYHSLLKLLQSSTL